MLYIQIIHCRFRLCTWKSFIGPTDVVHGILDIVLASYPLQVQMLLFIAGTHVAHVTYLLLVFHDVVYAIYSHKRSLYY